MFGGGGLLLLFFCDTPCPQEKFTCLKRFTRSQDQLLYYPNLYLKLSQEQCASYILYMLPSNIEENIECKLKEKIRFHKKGNQVWQKGSTRFASGAQVAENELARLFDREHFSEKTRNIVRPSMSCTRMLSFLILIQLLKSSWSWHIELWFRTIKGQGAETGSIVCPRYVWEQSSSLFCTTWWRKDSEKVQN